MLSIVNLARTCLAKIISFLYVIVTTLTAGLPINPGELPQTPSDFEPVIRFAVCSDIHIGGNTEDEPEQERLKQLIDFMYDYCDSQSYTGFDALCVVGDMTDDGYDYQYDIFNNIIDENLNEGIELVICTGNHEYIATRDYDASISAEMFKTKMNRAEDNHIVINGYHFISVSYSDDGKTFDSKLDWMDEEISAAVADSGDKPVFVFQHPAPFATVYGSISWGDFDIDKVLAKYPTVVDFSGHSHYPINDPRSMWQGSFTALGCGTLSYFETDLDGIASNFPYDNNQAAQFYIVECDKDGNTRILSYDLITEQFFDNEYYLTGLADRNFPYSYARMKARDEAPVWSEDTQITTSVNENGETILTFTGATDKYIVESYKVSVQQNGIPFTSDNFTSKYLYLFMDDVYDVNLGCLTSGKTYTVEITALNAYAETSKALTYKFVA